MLSHSHPVAPHHLPPHERRKAVQFVYEESDWQIFTDVFGDLDTAKAAVTIIEAAPPEIQILFYQMVQLVKEA